MKKILALIFVVFISIPSQSFARLISDCGYECFVDYDSIELETKIDDIWIAKVEIENHGKKQIVYVKNVNDKMFVSKDKTIWHEPETLGSAGPILCAKVERYIKVFK